jgi:hypothetical protein
MSKSSLKRRLMNRVREAILMAPRNFKGKSGILGYGPRTRDCSLEWSRVV